MNTVVRSVLRVASAVLVVAGGVLHYRIWESDYRQIPNGAVPGWYVVKIGFPVNAVVSLVLAVALVAFARRPIVWLAALLFEVASIITLVLSREASVLRWTEADWSTNAKQVLAAELAAAVLLAVLLLVDFVRSGSGSAAHPAPA